MGHAVQSLQFSMAGGCATRVQRKLFGGFIPLIWLISEANAEINRAIDHWHSIDRKKRLSFDVNFFKIIVVYITGNIYGILICC